MKNIGVFRLIAVLLVVAGGVWWFMTFERVTEPVYAGLHGAAREDPYLALRQLLKRGKVRMEEPAAVANPALKFDNLPAGGTLLLGDRRHVLMTPERVKKIAAWVAAGGHLIVEAEYPGRPDPLLAAFDLGRADLARPKPKPNVRAPAEIKGGNNPPKPDGASGKPSATPFSKGLARRATEITEVTLPDDGRSLKVEFGAYQNLQMLKQKGFHRVSDSLGTRLATGAHGAGRVSAISNFDFLIYRGTFDLKDTAMQPTHLGKHDHAELVLRLVRLNPNHSQAALRLVWGNDDVSLWTWLVEHASYALASLALLLAAWLWRVVPRFGPLMPDTAPAEQKLSSHLQAAGRFYWKHMAPVEIYASMRAAFVQRLSERRPGIAARGAAARNAELAQLAGVRVEAVARALDQSAHSVGELVRNAILLQRVSQKL